MTHSDNKLRFAVIGLGTMGRQHVRVLDSLEQVELVAGVDLAQKECESISERYNINTVSTISELLEIGIDAAIVATPTPAHFATTIELLRAGVDVLVEKPVAASIYEALGMESLASQLGRIIMVGHIERFNPAVRVLKEILEAQMIGDVVTITVRRVGFNQPQDIRASVIFDLAIHDLDIIKYLLGLKGEIVYAHSAQRNESVSIDHVDICLKFGPSFAYLQANWITPVKIRKLSVTGTQGFAEIDFVEQKVDLYQDNRSSSTANQWNLFSGTKHSVPSSLDVTSEEPLILELQHFVECVTNRTQPIANIQDATLALGLAMDATVASSKTASC